MSKNPQEGVRQDTDDDPLHNIKKATILVGEIVNGGFEPQGSGFVYVHPPIRFAKGKSDQDEKGYVFQNIIWWVQQTFTTYRKEMKTVEWGPLYDWFKDEKLDTTELERRTAELMQDPDVTKRKGIYAYLLTGEERHLSIRQFDDREKRAAYKRQNHKCANGTRCRTPGNDDGQHVFEIDEMEGDHIQPWSKGGKTVAENCQMLCVPCNRYKGGL